MESIKDYMLSDEESRLICLVVALKTTDDKDLNNNLKTVIGYYRKAKENFLKIELEEFIPQSLQDLKD